jgi:hypothetical protein
MPISVVATGRVTGAPSRVSADDGALAVFVFDPYPEPTPESTLESTPAGRAHGCEVLCRDDRLVGEVLRHGVVGAWVAVRGELTLSRALGPVEDELGAVRVDIEADEVCFERGSTPNG